jgi:hypothetical protein
MDLDSNNFQTFIVCENQYQFNKTKSLLKMKYANKVNLIHPKQYGRDNQFNSFEKAKYLTHMKLWKKIIKFNTPAVIISGRLTYVSEFKYPVLSYKCLILANEQKIPDWYIVTPKGAKLLLKKTPFNSFTIVDCIHSNFNNEYESSLTKHEQHFKMQISELKLKDQQNIFYYIPNEPTYMDRMSIKCAQYYNDNFEIVIITHKPIIIKNTIVHIIDPLESWNEFKLKDPTNTIITYLIDTFGGLYLNNKMICIKSFSIPTRFETDGHFKIGPKNSSFQQFKMSYSNSENDYLIHFPDCKLNNKGYFVNTVKEPVYFFKKILKF